VLVPEGAVWDERLGGWYTPAHQDIIVVITGGMTAEEAEADRLAWEDHEIATKSMYDDVPDLHDGPYYSIPGSNSYTDSTALGFDDQKTAIPTLITHIAWVITTLSTEFEFYQLLTGAKSIELLIWLDDACHKLATHLINHQELLSIIFGIVVCRM
jgi:hypothetical protein